MSFKFSFLFLSHHVCLDGAGVVQGEAAGVVAQVPGAHSSDPQTEHLTLLTVDAVHSTALLNLNIVFGPGHLNREP